MPLQWRNQIWQSLEEGAGKRCSEYDDGPLSSFQGRSSSASSFQASLLPAIDGVPSLALYPQVVSQAPQLVKVALPANLSARSFPFTLACPGQYTHRSLPVHITISDLVHSSRSHQCQADFLLLFFNCSDPVMLKLCSLVNTPSRS